MINDYKAKAEALVAKAGYGGGKAQSNTARPTTGPIHTPAALERARGGSTPKRADGGSAPSTSRKRPEPEPEITQEDLDNLGEMQRENRRQDRLEGIPEGEGATETVRARGGSTPKHKKGNTTVNVVIGAQGGQPGAPPPPHPMPMPMPRPPMGGPPPGPPPGMPPGGPPPGMGGPPPGMPPGPPPGMRPPGMKAGGKVQIKGKKS